MGGKRRQVGGFLDVPIYDDHIHADENAWDGIRVIGNIHQGEGVE